MAGYGLRTVINLTIPALRREEKEDIYQYRERKKAERKSPAGLFLAGVMYFVLSLVALTVYEFV